MPGWTTSPPPQATTRRSGRVPPLDELALELPETGLPLLGEDLRNRLADPPLDLVVAVDALEAQPVGDRAPNGGLAGSHEADKVQVNVLGVHEEARRGWPGPAGPLLRRSRSCGSRDAG